MWMWYSCSSPRTRRKRPSILHGVANWRRQGLSLRQIAEKLRLLGLGAVTRTLQARAPKVRNRGVEQGSRNRRKVSRWGTFPLWEQNAAIGLLLTAGVPSSDDRCAGSSPSCLVLRQ